MPPKKITKLPLVVSEYFDTDIGPSFMLMLLGGYRPLYKYLVPRKVRGISKPMTRAVFKHKKTKRTATIVYGPSYYTFKPKGAPKPKKEVTTYRLNAEVFSYLTDGKSDETDQKVTNNKKPSKKGNTGIKGTPKRKTR